MPFEFQPEEDGKLTLEQAVFQALGAASVCWETVENAGVFQSDHAEEIGQAFLDKIFELMTDHAIDVLNRVHEKDPTVMPALMLHRVPCNEALADDPTVQVGVVKEGFEVGFLGLLNGVLGIDGQGRGWVAAEMYGRNLKQFKRTPK